MTEKTFHNDKRFLHIPICDEPPRNYQYIKVYDGARMAGEFHIGIAYGDKPTDFFVALNLGNYVSPSVTLVCESDIASIFEGIVSGGNPEEERKLYPNLYSEPTRQQIHFSAKRGWLNDPNGLFIKDGKFHLYFQHNPFGSRHGGVNVSWGHATSEDGVHFTEYPDAIMPYSSRCLVASGSAIVDKNNCFGKGEGAVIAAYTALQARQYGRAPVTQNEGQMLLYSLDDGKTFKYFEKNPIIAVTDGEYWRDPKILDKDGRYIVVVYEPVGEEKRTSLYALNDRKEWEFISNGEGFHECPDFFELEVAETGEKLFVTYGGHGCYSVGSFDGIKFTPIERGHYLDYGDSESLYAGQSFNNNSDPSVRYHTAWLKENEMCCYIPDDYVFQKVGFHCSLSLICSLTLHKTEKGYRVFRTPNENIKTLRRKCEKVELTASQILDVPCEYVFTLEQSVTFVLNGKSLIYAHDKKSVRSSSGKEYEICGKTPPKIRMIVDTMSVEFCINDETMLTYYLKTAEKPLEILGVDKIKTIKYSLSSIWEKIK